MTGHASALNRHLAEMGVPLYSGSGPLTDEQIRALVRRHRPVPWCSCPPCGEWRALPWWSRLFKRREAFVAARQASHSAKPLVLPSVPELTEEG